MQTKITPSVVQNTKPREKRFVVHDTLLKGLVMFVRPTGKKTWYVDYRISGKRTHYLIGDTTLFTVTEAREEARKILSGIARGEDPKAEEDIQDQNNKSLALGEFIRDVYGPWVTENRRTGRETIIMLLRAFKSFLSMEIEQITLAQLEQWRAQERKKRGVKASSLNRETTALRAAINWGIGMEYIEKCPLVSAKFKALAESDSEKIVRYLSEEERARLMAALDEREQKMRKERDSHNQWLKERGLETMPQLKGFADHLKPMILLALNTGIRRNALFSLEWRDVDFANKTIVVRAATSKSGKMYHVPMNKQSLNALTKWHKQSTKIAPNNLVFPSPQTGKKIDNCNTAWGTLLKMAELENFRWHDMRHDFASQLVMSGVDLNTVRELLGHADLKMTLRYAHLAPAAKMKAVEMLDRQSA